MAKTLLRVDGGTISARTGNLDEIGVFIGSTAPTGRTLLEGDCWLDTNTTTNFILKLRDNSSAWISQN